MTVLRKKLFFQFNAALSSLVPVDTLFSFARIITSPHCCADQYLEDRMKNVTVLRSYLIVKKFFQFNAALSSLVPVDRLFSFARIITRPHC